MIEVRRFVISDRVGEEPRPSVCMKCEEGVIDATDQNQVCRKCGALNGTGTDFVNRGFTFKFRIGTGMTLDIRVRRRDDDLKYGVKKEYLKFVVKG